MDFDNNVAQWALIVGFALPPVLAVLMQTHWTTQVKSLVAFVVCAVAGLGTAFFAGELSDDWVSSALIVLVTGISTYQGFWKPSGIAPTIEATTTVTEGTPRGNPPIDG